MEEYIEEILICECNSSEHSIIFKYNTIDNDWDEVFVDIHLSKLPFFKRIIYAFKYIFGYKCRYGAFDEIILKAKDANKIQKIVDFLNKVNDKNK